MESYNMWLLCSGFFHYNADCDSESLGAEPEILHFDSLLGDAHVAHVRMAFQRGWAPGWRGCGPVRSRADRSIDFSRIMACWTTNKVDLLMLRDTEDLH